MNTKTNNDNILSISYIKTLEKRIDFLEVEMDKLTETVSIMTQFFISKFGFKYEQND